MMYTKFIDQVKNYPIDNEARNAILSIEGAGFFLWGSELVSRDFGSNFTIGIRLTPVSHTIIYTKNVDINEAIKSAFIELKKGVNYGNL